MVKKIKIRKNQTGYFSTEMGGYFSVNIYTKELLGHKKWGKAEINNI